jgi:hypothetical protein
MVGNSHLRYSDYLIVDGQAMHAAVVQPLRGHAEQRDGLKVTRPAGGAWPRHCHVRGAGAAGLIQTRPLTSQAGVSRGPSSLPSLLLGPWPAPAPTVKPGIRFRYTRYHGRT